MLDEWAEAGAQRVLIKNWLKSPALQSMYRRKLLRRAFRYLMAALTASVLYVACLVPAVLAWGWVNGNAVTAILTLTWAAYGPPAVAGFAGYRILHRTDYCWPAEAKRWKRRWGGS